MSKLEREEKRGKKAIAYFESDVFLKALRDGKIRTKRIFNDDCIAIKDLFLLSEGKEQEMSNDSSYVAITNLLRKQTV